MRPMRSVTLVTTNLREFQYHLVAAAAASRRASLAVLAPIFLGRQAGLNSLTTNSNNNKPIERGYPERPHNSDAM